MTAWATDPDGPPELLIDFLSRHIDKPSADEALAAATELILGMTTLCGVVIVINEDASRPRRAHVPPRTCPVLRREGAGAVSVWGTAQTSSRLQLRPSS